MALPKYPNRIKEIRLARGLSAEKLGKLCGTSQQQIQRLEVGDRKLTQEWMERLARCLKVAPADLLPTAAQAGQDDIADTDIGVPGVASAMAQRGLHIYRLTTDAVSALGLERDEVVKIDESEGARSAIKTGDVVLVSIRSGDHTIRVLRQFVAPRLYVSHPKSGNACVILADDMLLNPKVVGVLMTQ